MNNWTPLIEKHFAPDGRLIEHTIQQTPDGKKVSIKEALAQPEQEPESIWIGTGHLREILNGNTLNAYCSPEQDRFTDVKLYTTPPQPKEPEQPAQQEPVAWRAPNWGHGDDEWVYRDFDDPVLIADGKPSPNNEALYTTPPQRKPLTDEQYRAVRGAHYVTASDKYFGARSHTMDTNHNRTLFEAAFNMGFEAAHGIKE